MAAISNSTTNVSLRLERLMQNWREGEAAASAKLRSDLGKMGIEISRSSKSGGESTTTAVMAAAAAASESTVASANPDTGGTSANPDTGTPSANPEGVSTTAASAAAAAIGGEGSGPSANPDTGAPSANPDVGSATAARAAAAVTGGEGSGPSANPDTGAPSANPDTGIPSANPDGGTVSPVVASVGMSAAAVQSSAAQATEEYEFNGIAVVGNGAANKLEGSANNDMLIDSGATGNGKTAPDTFSGGEGDDMIHTRWGRDTVDGGAGNDIIVSRTDGGEPVLARPDDDGQDRYYAKQPFSGESTDDRLTGGAGADTFLFRIDINARANIIAKHTDKAGTIDWEGVTGENNLDHDHWVDTFGTDVITDFNKADGDKIVISGHTTEVTSVTYEDKNKDGKLDSVIKVISQQGANGAHDEDYLGTIVVLGDGTDNSKVLIEEIEVNAGAHHGSFENIDEMYLVPPGDGQILGATAATSGADVLLGSKGADKLSAGDGDDLLVDLGSYKDNAKDSFAGGNGADIIRTHWGADTVDGGDGADLIVSRSDAGEPEVAQEANNASHRFPGQPFSAKVTNDTLTGGGGGDTFFFRLDLNATNEILAKHVHDYSENHDHGDGETGNIDWHGVTGENGAAHLHWLDSIGVDTITDFSKADGDVIEIEGHTVEVASVTYEDVNMDGNEDSIIQLRSQQGAAGSHDEDLLGQIIVLGDGTADSRIENANDHITVDANVHHGAFGNIDEINFV